MFHSLNKTTPLGKKDDKKQKKIQVENAKQN
jgi:hypothetical protein